jgi:alpha-galactosidase
MLNKTLLTLTFTFLICSASEAEAAEKVRVFILAGQSNMQGLGSVELGGEFKGVNEKGRPIIERVPGAIGSLRHMVREDPTEFAHLVDERGAWVVRDDVWIWSRNGQDYDKDGDKNNDTRTGGLTVGYGAVPKDGVPRIGPEFGFGHAVGEAYDEQVVIVKIAWGGKSLAVDYRPPSAVEKRGVPMKNGVPRKGAGVYYDLLIKNTKDALAAIETRYPNKDIVLSGFGWHQGFNDRLSTDYRREYAANLADFIVDIRKELGVPKLPFVIATTGMNPLYRESRNLELHRAQVGVADASLHPEFAGSVAAVDTRGFWRENKVSPSADGPHWNQNGESYYQIGAGMGEAMVELVPAKTP